MNVYFHMAVNDYDGYGMHTGRLHAADFTPEGDWEPVLHLECLWFNEAKETACYRVGGDRLRVGRRIFPILGYRCYVGNLMFDAALVTAEVAQQIAETLRATGKYAPDMGMETLWDAWDSGGPIVFADGERKAAANE